MSGRFFLDTNVFIYSFDLAAQQKSHRAAQLIGEGIQSGKGTISYQVVQEFLNAALRRFAKPMTSMEAEQYFTSILRPLVNVHSSPGLFAEALLVFTRYKFSWYDSLIIAAAVESACEVLYTEDLRHGQKIGSLIIVNPFL